MAIQPRSSVKYAKRFLIDLAADRYDAGAERIEIYAVPKLGKLEVVWMGRAHAARGRLWGPFVELLDERV